MFKKAFLLVIASVFVLGNVSVARAQNLDLSHIVAANLAFDQQFNQLAWKLSLEAARWHRETGTPIPFNAMTLNQSNRELQKTYDSYNRQAQINSNRTSQAISNWTNGAIRGNGLYQAPNGATYNLPWTHNQYHINQYGQAVPDYNPYRVNVTPYHGR